MTLRRLLLTLLLALGLLPLPTFSSPAAAQAGCGFTLGFRALRDQIPQIVGSCLENEHFNVANGNAEQRTTGGLLVWRKADNWTAFTDGATTWINGPVGLQSRANGDRFPWEASVAAGGGSPSGAASGNRSADVQASLTASGWATVTQVLGPATLQVQTASGNRFRVWHIGVIGPTEDQGDWLPKAAQEQARRLPAGTRVWLQAESGLENPAEGWALRHVLRDGDAAKPVGAELLRAGTVWVYPHAAHAYMAEYADAQAEAVRNRAGAWAETNSKEIFRPRGETRGGYPVSPQVVPALRAIDANEAGHALLVSVNRFPVEIGVSRSGPNEIGFFIPRYYTIQVADSISNAPAESIAAVLMHEVTHAQQMIDKLVSRREIDCYASEIEAFGVSAQYWASLYGQGGKPRPAHWLDRELNATLQEYRSNAIDQRVRQAYVQECANNS